MIKEYENLSELVRENSSYISNDCFLSGYFFSSVSCFREKSYSSYAVMTYDETRKLFAAKTDGNDLIISGEKELINELIEYLIVNNYDIFPFISNTVIGELVKDILFQEYGIASEEVLSLKIMKSTELSENKYPEVITAEKEDAAQIHNMLQLFYDECNLIEETDSTDTVRSNISAYRVIKENEEIVSMCEISDQYISHVYTLPEKRGEGFGRKIVESAKNEIIRIKGYSMLNVDGMNKKLIRLYESLGFSIIFSKSEFSLID